MGVVAASRAVYAWCLQEQRLSRSEVSSNSGRVFVEKVGSLGQF